METLPLAHRARQVAPFLVMAMLRDACQMQAAGKTVYRLEAGQPALPAPQSVTRAVIERLATDPMAYTESKGLLALRQGICDHYQAQYGIIVSPERILITPGSSGAFILVFAGCFDVGDRVGLAVPGYPAYRHIFTSLGIETVSIPAGAATQYKITVENLEKAGKLDGLVLASPANPTGTMHTAKELQVISDYCRAQGIRLISDEIYHGITYDQPATCLLNINPDAIVINSFSKYYCMTGWRVGWMVVPEGTEATFEAMAQSLQIAAPTPSQYGALAALDCRAELDARVRQYQDNRSILLQGLQACGIEQIAPVDGAMYAYADFSRYTSDSLTFTRKLLAQTGIAATAGVDFAPQNGGKFVRFFYAGDAEMLKTAMEKLDTYLRQQ